MPTVEADKQLQAETTSPKIPALEVKAPNYTNTVSKTGVEGSVPKETDTSSGYDPKTELSETNVHDKFVDLSQGPSND